MKSTGEPITAAHPVSTRTLWLVYLVLMGLLAGTVLVAYVPLGVLNLVLAGIIALVKAGLVIWFFMHLKEMQRLDGVLFGSSAFMLMIAAILSLVDYLTR